MGKKVTHSYPPWPSRREGMSNPPLPSQREGERMNGMFNVQRSIFNVPCSLFPNEAHDVIDSTIDTELTHIEADVVVAGIVPLGARERLGI